MNKYKYSDDNGTKLVQQILNDIANELVEMNRLKRLELLNVFSKNSCISISVNKQELEDQA